MRRSSRWLLSFKYLVVPGAITPVLSRLISWTIGENVIFVSALFRSGRPRDLHRDVSRGGLVESCIVPAFREPANKRQKVAMGDLVGKVAEATAGQPGREEAVAGGGIWNDGDVGDAVGAGGGSAAEGGRSGRPGGIIEAASGASDINDAAVAAEESSSESTASAHTRIDVGGVVAGSRNASSAASGLDGTRTGSFIFRETHQHRRVFQQRKDGRQVT